jgi:nucleoside-diphosphate-sugar epimerase
VDNVVDANLRALEARGLKGQAVNVATGRAVTLNALLQTLSRIVKRRARAKHVKARAGDIRHSLADISRAQRLLGYRPQVDLRTGLERTVEWYRTHSRSSATR